MPTAVNDRDDKRGADLTEHLLKSRAILQELEL